MSWKTAKMALTACELMGPVLGDKRFTTDAKTHWKDDHLAEEGRYREHFEGVWLKKWLRR